MRDTMTTNEKRLFYRMESDIKDILEAIKGDPITKTPGFADRLSRIEERMGSMDQKIKGLARLMIGIGIGLIVGGLLFGFVSWDTVISLLK